MSNVPRPNGETPPRRGHRKDLLRLTATVVLVAVIVLAGWMSLVYAFDTSNPILIVEGDSMVPTLLDGDLVFLRGTTLTEIADDFKAGSREIIVYFSEPWDRYIVHRVREVTYDSNGRVTGLITQGDNNAAADPGIVQDSQLVGKVVGRVPSVGLAVKFFRSPPGIALLSLVIIILVVWSALDGVRSRDKKYA